MCRHPHRPPNYSNHCVDPFPTRPDSWDYCLWQSFDRIPMLRHHFHRCFVHSHWQCRDRCASSGDCADAICLANVCNLLCIFDCRHCYCCSYCAPGCCANADSNCAISANGPNIRTNIDTIAAANFVCCICALFDCANWRWPAAAAMLVHHSCRNFCEPFRENVSNEAINWLVFEAYRAVLHFLAFKWNAW